MCPGLHVLVCWQTNRGNGSLYHRLSKDISKIDKGGSCVAIFQAPADLILKTEKFNNVWIQNSYCQYIWFKNFKEWTKKSDQKSLIWDYFIQSDKDLSKAPCNLSGGVYSMGSDKPKIKTTTNLKNHLKGKHHNEFKKFLDNCDAAKEKREMSAHFGTVTQCSVEPTVPKCALIKFQNSSKICFLFFTDVGILSQSSSLVHFSFFFFSSITIVQEFLKFIKMLCF